MYKLYDFDPYYFVKIYIILYVKFIINIKKDKKM